MVAKTADCCQHKATVIQLIFKNYLSIIIIIVFVFVQVHINAAKLSSFFNTQPVSTLRENIA
jgi:hypothetical protein